MKAVTLVIVSVAAILSSAIVFLVFAHSEPSTTALDVDLASVQAEIKAADDEAAKYQGGLIVSLIEARKALLKITAVMLEQKRASLIRRVDLHYVVQSEAIAPDSAKASAIAADLDRAKAKMAEDQAKADEYSGGLIQIMLLMTVATDRMSIAQLHIAEVGAKYGVMLPISIAAPPSPSDSVPVGTIVKDKDAL